MHAQDRGERTHALVDQLEQMPFWTAGRAAMHKQSRIVLFLGVSASVFPKDKFYRELNLAVKHADRHSWDSAQLTRRSATCFPCVGDVKHLAFPLAPQQLSIESHYRGDTQ